MKKVWILLSVPLLMFSGTAFAADQVNLYLFSTKRCLNCAKEKKFLSGLQQRVPGLVIRDLDVIADPANAKLLAKAAASFNLQARGTPVTFVGASEPIVGYQDDETTGRLIEERVRACLAHGDPDLVGRLIASGGVPPPTAAPRPPRGDGSTAAATSGTVVALPLVGKTDLSTLPLLTLTVTLGALDSFNPCAFFVLLTLLGMLVHARSRARMLAIGGVFVTLSGVVYFVFMAAWLNVFLLIGELRAVTTAAGLVALGVASINIKDFFWFKRGVSLSIPESKKPKLFERMRGLLRESSWPALIAATTVLAVAANTYELLCTAGFPLVFTRILTLNRLPAATYYFHLALYNLVYVLPLAAIVTAFSLTLGSRKLTERQGRIMKLVSGMMMLGLGTVVLVDPSLFSNMLVGVGLLAFALLATAAVVGLEHWRRRPGGRAPLAGIASGGVR